VWPRRGARARREPRAPRGASAAGRIASAEHNRASWGSMALRKVAHATDRLDHADMGHALRVGVGQPQRQGFEISRAAGPIVKWVGGKSKLIPELVRRAPSSFRRYFEPFAGGAALFFHLAPRAAVLSDTNAELIAFYRAVRENVEGVIAEL